MGMKHPAGVCGSFAVCIDSYHNGVPVGRFYTERSHEAFPFHSVTQCLTLMEQVMDAARPEPDGKRPAFHHTQRRMPAVDILNFSGKTGTFLVRVLFRQNGSWQGSVTWLEGKQEQSFRSVLELILLVDSALQGHINF